MVKPVVVPKINVKKLSADPKTRRKYYDPVTLQKLVEDIEENGFKPEHALVVRPHPKKRGYWLITCGQNRFEAGAKAGIVSFPCVKRERQTDIIALREAYKDNVLRCEPDPITEAEYFYKIGIEILKSWDYTKKDIKKLKRKMPIEQIALEMGVTNTFVKHRLKLLRLPIAVQKMVSRFYMKGRKGFKLPPSIGEELVRALELLRMQGVNNAEKEIVILAFKFYKDKVNVKEARSTIADIGYLGYEKWKNRKIVVDEHGIRCAVCGRKADKGDYPWIPLCNNCKSKVLGRDKKLKESPFKPLHEQNPELHKPRKG